MIKHVIPLTEADFGTEQEIRLTKSDNRPEYYLVTKNEEPLDSWGAKWGPKETAVVLTKNELLKLKELIDTVLQNE